LARFFHSENVDLSLVFTISNKELIKWQCYIVRIGLNMRFVKVGKAYHTRGDFVISKWLVDKKMSFTI